MLFSSTSNTVLIALIFTDALVLSAPIGGCIGGICANINVGNGQAQGSASANIGGYSASAQHKGQFKDLQDLTEVRKVVLKERLTYRDVVCF